MFLMFKKNSCFYRPCDRGYKTFYAEKLADFYFSSSAAAIPAKNYADLHWHQIYALRDKAGRLNTPILSSASVERLFAVGSDILRSKLSSMTKKNFEKFVLLRENEKCLGKSIFLHE